MSKQLFDALSNGELEMVLKQLNTGIDINTRGNLGETPLITAARLGHKQIVNYLLQKGADPEIKDFDGITALFLAIRNRNTAIIYEIANAVALAAKKAGFEVKVKAEKSGKVKSFLDEASIDKCVKNKISSKGIRK